MVRGKDHKHCVHDTRCLLAHWQAPSAKEGECVCP